MFSCYAHRAYRSICVQIDISNLIIIIITILSLGSSSNCFVIRNLVTVIFQAKERRPHVLNEKSSDQGPQRLHTKNANIHSNLQQSSAKIRCAKDVYLST